MSGRKLEKNYEDEKDKKQGPHWENILWTKTTFLFVCYWNIIFNLWKSHTADVASPPRSWLGPHDKGSASSINSWLDWFHILPRALLTAWRVWHHDRWVIPVTPTAQASAGFASGRWQSDSLPSAQRSVKDICPIKEIDRVHPRRIKESRDLISHPGLTCHVEKIWSFALLACINVNRNLNGQSRCKLKPRCKKAL